MSHVLCGSRSDDWPLAALDPQVMLLATGNRIRVPGSCCDTSTYSRARSEQLAVRLRLGYKPVATSGVVHSVLLLRLVLAAHCLLI